MAAPIDPLSHTSVAQKIRSKELAQNMRFGSPKLRDLLRQKCRIRFKEARILSFDTCRSPVEQLTRKNLLNATIRDELKELNFDIELQERLFDELSEEAATWSLYQQDQQDTEYLEQLADAPDPFFCPICQKTLLDLVFGHYSCSTCNLKFKSANSLDHFQYSVLRKIVEHDSIGCDKTVNFFAEPIPDCEFVMLNMFCDSCDFYACLKPSTI